MIPPWEDQCELHRMTRMTGPDCAVMCNLINIHTYIHSHPIGPQPYPVIYAVANLASGLLDRKITEEHIL